MSLETCFQTHSSLLMEGAILERIKREFRLVPDEIIALAGLAGTEAGQKALAELWGQYGTIARKYHLPFLAATPTRRADPERLKRAGRNESVWKENLAFLKAIRDRSGIEMYAGGMLGCRGDAYTGEGALPESDAYRLHRRQAEAFREGGADYLYAALLPTLPEAIGMARALAATGLPYLLSFTIRRDGKLIDGNTIHEAVAAIDAAGPKPPLCYLAGCVHPNIVYEALSQPFNRSNLIRSRFSGIQGNTSALSYAELDGSRELRGSDPEEFADAMIRLKQDMGFRILGGCCGTDSRHLEAVARRM